MVHQLGKGPSIPHAAHLRYLAKSTLPNQLAVHTSDPGGPNSCLPSATDLPTGLAHLCIILKAASNYLEIFRVTQFH